MRLLFCRGKIKRVSGVSSITRPFSFLWHLIKRVSRVVFFQLPAQFSFFWVIERTSSVFFTVKFSFFRLLRGSPVLFSSTTFAFSGYNKEGVRYYFRTTFVFSGLKCFFAAQFSFFLVTERVSGVFCQNKFWSLRVILKRESRVFFPITSTTQRCVWVSTPLKKILLWSRTFYCCRVVRVVDYRGKVERRLIDSPRVAAALALAPATAASPHHSNAQQNRHHQSTTTAPATKKHPSCSCPCSGRITTNTTTTTATATATTLISPPSPR